MINNSTKFKSFIHGAGLSICVKGFAVISMFLMNLIIARSLGLVEAGLFFFGFTIITLLSSLGRLGLEQTLVRNIAVFKKSNSFSHIRSIYKKSMLWSFAFCVVCSIILILVWDPLISKIFTAKGFKPVFIIIILCLPFFSLNILQAYAFQGMEKVVTSLTFLSILIPVQVSTYVYLFELDSATQTAFAFLISTLIALVIGFFSWVQSLPKSQKIGIVADKIILKSSVPLWGYVVLSQLIQWYSQLVLGIFGNVSDVAILAVSQRISLLVSVMLLAVNHLVAPKFARLFSEKNTRELKKLTVWTVRLLLMVGLPVLAAIIIFPEQILSLFGKEYIDGAKTLIILAIGQLVNITTGSVAFLLSMTKHEKELRNNTLVTVMIIIPVGLYLISSFGLLGAAITTSLSVSLHNVLLAVAVRKKLNINVFKII